MAKRKATYTGANPLDLVVGSLGSTTVDLFADYALGYAGLLAAVVYRDAAGNYVFGYGTGDAVVDVSGILMYLYGDKIGINKDIGLAWLLTHLSVKLSELYNYIKKIYPLPPYPTYP